MDDIGNHYDGDWRLFKYDPHTGTKVWHLDLGTHIVVRTETPVDELIDDNHAHYVNSQNKRFGEGQRVASIPMDVYQKFLGDAVAAGDQEYVKKWLNDSDNKKWRTFRGNL